MRYCIWNNKGGVGKTFLTYLMATEYAVNNPEKEIVVVDMCPQANISEILLGGNGIGQENLEKCFSNELTIASYIKKRFSNGKNGLLGSETQYFVKVNDYNTNLPKNIYLLPGDNELDVCSSLINYLASSPEKKAWVNSRNLLLELMTSFTNASKKERVYFIDCNPSFSPYTELAIIASNRLIVPCTADNASMRGIHNIFKLLYGINQDESQFTQFYEKIQENNITLPTIYRVVLNKSRTSDQNASQAFSANQAQINEISTTLRNSYPDRFSDDNNTIYNIKDGNTLAVVVNHTGKALNDITIGRHTVYDLSTQINKKQKSALMDDIATLVSQL